MGNVEYGIVEECILSVLCLICLSVLMDSVLSWPLFGDHVLLLLVIVSPGKA